MVNKYRDWNPVRSHGCSGSQWCRIGIWGHHEAMFQLPLHSSPPIVSVSLSPPLQGPPPKVKSTDPTVRILSFIPCPGLTNILHPRVLTRITFILLTERNKKWILDECKASMGMVLMSVTWRSPGCPLTMTKPLSKRLAAPKIYVLLDVSQPPGSSWHLSWPAPG